MKRTNKDYVGAIQIFEPERDALYTVDNAGQIAHTSRRRILIYYKHGLISPVTDPVREGYYFDGDTIRTLRRIEFLRCDCGVNLTGIKMILQLINEVEHLREEPVANSSRGRHSRLVGEAPPAR
jgi:MerR family transcriptional regulator/heat shock protein HspR